MNDTITARVKCPFYIAHNRGVGNSITITCENVCANIGFDVKNLLSFANEKQRLDFMEIFCMDVKRCESCPYYEIIYKNKYMEAKDGNRKGS